MRRSIFFLLLASLAACRPAPKAPVMKPDFPERPPVVDAQPVDTKSYEAGYQVGYAVGLTAARPLAKPPAQGDIEQLAAEAAVGDPTRNKKWRSGWAAGYLEGFRSHALKTK